jgi:hypothetical protein
MIEFKDKIVYKAAIDPNSHPVLIELKIPAFAQRVEFKMLTTVANKKYAERTRGRASFAYVQDIWLLEQDLLADDPDALREGESIRFAISAFDFNTTYMKGFDIHPNWFDRNPCERCSNGINYFLDKDAAISYAAYDHWFYGRMKEHQRQGIEDQGLFRGPIRYPRWT